MEDNKNKPCKICGEGTYQETTLLDDMKGVLHCDLCGDEIDRYIDEE